MASDDDSATSCWMVFINSVLGAEANLAGSRLECFGVIIFSNAANEDY